MENVENNFKIEDARLEALFDLYDKLDELEVGTEKWKNTIDGIKKLEDIITERYKVDWEYQSKIETAELDAKIKKDETKARIDIAEMEAKTRIEDNKSKIKAAKIEAESKVETARIESSGRSKDKQEETLQKIAEAGTDLLVMSIPLIVWMSELSKTREYELNNVELSSAFRKTWDMFRGIMR